MSRRYWGVKRIIARLLATTMLVTGLCAAWPEALRTASRVEAAASNAITYEYYTVRLKNVVPVSWLFVGTYLMSARGVTPQIYQEALKSRETYDQFIAFYTSELDGGAWKNIIDATNINHITATSGRVTEEELYPYLITCVIGDDGIPRDPVTGEPMNIYATPDPYEMENIPELDSIETYYNETKDNTYSNKSAAYRQQMLNWFFEYDNLQSYDRVNLNVPKAYNQYQELLDDPKKLEDIWDQAMTLNPADFPMEYEDIMMVMRNFPNIRDSVTDRSDEELQQLDALFLELQTDKMSEEADAVLYVSAQVDATRRAEIYYNLTTNNNLTGSLLLGDRSDLIEELTLKREEVNAEMMALSASSDRAEAPMKRLRQEINDMENENAELQSQLEEENASYEAADPESRLLRLNQEQAAIEAEFAPIEEEFNKREEAWDRSFDESVALDDAQNNLSAEIKELKQSKKDYAAQADEELAALAAEIEEKTRRYNVAELQRPQYEEAVANLEIINSNLERVNAAIFAETTHYDGLVEESSFYTSSRMDALVNSGKIYDPEKKSDLDQQVGNSKKILDVLNSKRESLEYTKEELEPYIEEMQADLALGDTLEGLQQAYDELTETLRAKVAAQEAAADAEIEAKQTTLASLSEPFQQKLEELNAANTAYYEYWPIYNEKLLELSEKHDDVVACENTIEQHESLVASIKGQIAANKTQIKTREAMIYPLMPTWDAIEGQITALQDEVNELDVLIIKASTVTAEDEILRVAYGNTRNTIETRLEQINTAIAEAEKAQMKLLTENAGLLAERRQYEAAEITFLAEYDADVATIKQEEDAWDQKWQDAYTKAEYELYEYMNSAEPEQIRQKIVDERYTIAKFQRIISKMQPYVQNEKTLRDKSSLMIQKMTLANAISADVNLLTTSEQDEASAEEIHERINSNKELLAQINTDMASANGLTINSNQEDARRALTEEEITDSGIANLTGVDDTADQEFRAAMAEIDKKRKQLDETKKVYDATVGTSGKSFEAQKKSIENTIKKMDEDIEKAKHQYDWIGSVLKKILSWFGWDADAKIAEEVAYLNRQKRDVQKALDNANKFPELCEKYGYSDYAQGTDFAAYASQKYQQLQEEEDAAYAAAENGTPVQNYVAKLNTMVDEHEQSRILWQERLTAWESEHAKEIASMKQTIADASDKMEREKGIRQQRLNLAKEVYQTKVNDNLQKIAKINDTIEANNAIVKEYQENVDVEFGERAEELLAMIPGLSSYVRDLAERRTLAELKTYLEERLHGVDVDVSAMQAQKEQVDRLENVVTKQQERLNSIVSEWSQKDQEAYTSGTATYSSLRENWLKAQDTREKQQAVVDALKETANALQGNIGASQRVGTVTDKQRENIANASYLYNRAKEYQSNYQVVADQIAELEKDLQSYNEKIDELQKKFKKTEDSDLAEDIDDYKQKRNSCENQIKSLKKNRDYTAYTEAILEFYSALNRYGFTDYDRNSDSFTTYRIRKEAQWATEDANAIAALDALDASNKEQLANALENVRTNQQKLNDLIEEENSAKQAMEDAWEDMKTKQSIISSGYQLRVETQQAVVDDAKATYFEGQRKLQELKDAIDEYYGEPVADLAIQLAEADAKYRALDYVDSTYINEFGVAPTLQFMWNAMDSGEPGMGRKFTQMKKYRGLLGSSDYEADKELVELFASAQESCENAYLDYQKQAMTRGENAGDYTGFLMSRQVAKKATDKNAALPYLQMIVDLTNIEGGNVKHVAREISLLESYLVPFAMSDFTTEKSEERMDDYHYYIRALTERDTLENSIIFVENRLEYAYGLRTTFGNEGKTKLIEAHITWLENLLRALRQKQQGFTGEDYDEDEANLLKDRENAIEEGDLKQARKIDELLRRRASGGGEGDGDTAGKSDNTDDLEPTDIDPNNRPKPEQEILDLILDEIDQPEYDIKKDLNRFINIGGPIEELRKELDKVQNPKNADAILGTTPTDGDGDGGNNAPTSGSNRDITKSDIDGALNDTIGDLDNADDADLAAAAAALAELNASSPDDDVSSALDDLLNQLLADGNSYVYQQYMADQSTEYVSMAAVDNSRRTSGFRYVQENDTDLTTMTQVFGGSASYTFTNGSKNVIKNNNGKDTLSIAATRQTDKYVRGGDSTQYTYLSKEDAKKFLYVSGRYIKGTDMAILITQGMEPKVWEIVKALEERMLLTDE